MGRNGVNGSRHGARVTPYPFHLRSTSGSTTNKSSQQEDKDTRGPVGLHASRTRGLRCSQPPLGGLTK
jgi:hypothetical protein